jgi:hypothetical protein
MGMTRRPPFGAEPDAGVQMLLGVAVIADPEAVAVRIARDEAKRFADQDGASKGPTRFRRRGRPAGQSE